MVKINMATGAIKGQKHDDLPKGNSCSRILCEATTVIKLKWDGNPDQNGTKQTKTTGLQMLVSYISWKNKNDDPS